jgi:hypothetical protein
MSVAVARVAAVLKKPEKKDGKFVAKTVEPIKIILSDIKLKSIRRLIDSKGYNITIYIPDTINSEEISNISKLDDSIMREIVSSSHKFADDRFVIQKPNMSRVIISMAVSQ